MKYKYITRNNLYEKQTYMYSEFKGMDFIKEYLNSRKNCLNEFDKTETVGKGTEITYSVVYKDLLSNCENLKTGKNLNKAIASVNAYTKSFEVRKRIYTGYDAEWKPLNGAGFEEYESYLVFADCLLLAYHQTKCLKYFNCLLKLDDTLLSIQNRMGQEAKEHFRQTIQQELDIFNQLASANGISEGVS